jgi:uncharacterized membrane protein YgdD (TMEM256/DUF423 family)
VSARTILVIASLLAGLSVALGAFGAHALKGVLSARMMAAYSTGVEYQLAHSLALLMSGFSINQWPHEPFFRWGSWSLLIGVVLFSGSLYLMSLLSIFQLGMVTPIGGILIIVGWALMGGGFFRSVQSH